MKGHFLSLNFRRLYSSTSRVSSLRRISWSSIENLSIFNREKRILQSYRQNPKHNFASIPNSELHSRPNPNPAPQPKPENCGPKDEQHPNPNANLVSDASHSLDARLTEDEKRIWAVERLSKGKKYSKLDMKQNRVPGFVCVQDSPHTQHVLILMDRFQIQNLWSLLGEERFLCTIFTLDVFDGFGSNNVLYRERVLPRRINFDKSGEIANVGFTKALPGMKMRLDVPIRINGQEDCPGLRKGGILKVYLSYVSLLCLPEELPPCVEIHVNGMDIGERVCLGDLKIGVPIRSDSEPSLPVCEIIAVHT